MFTKMGWTDRQMDAQLENIIYNIKIGNKNSNAL